MAKRTKLPEKSTEQLELEQNIKTGFFNEAMDEPLPWFKLDSSILEDGELQELRDDYGKDICWDFIALVSLLAKRRRHVIDVSTSMKWKRLSASLEHENEEQTRAFIKLLSDYDLVDKSALECGLVVNNRIMRTAKDYAKTTANARFRAWCRYEKDKVE